MTSTDGRRKPEPRCPLRPGEVCNLCQLDVTGPHDCGLVYLVGADPDLRRGREVSAQPVSGR
ncbi:MAG: hypothetical protein CVT62_00585 [Actinobacteria bacterium HGW-Actinobacteria-2]|nr:MAG: hypothetical protein CVT62_00585 [Actinobacteria bacterium HGW-Actinobacteria-2]